MKTIDIEKTITLEGIMDIVSLDFSDSFEYVHEVGGIRCIGPFIMEGRYTTKNEVKQYKEVFEFDVFASNDKLSNETFNISFSDYDYEILGDDIRLMFHFLVKGLIEEEQVEEERDIDFSMMEELFDTSDSVSTSYSFVVIKEQDTYERIAERYQVNVNDLKELNKNKVLVTQSLLVLPIK